MLVIITAEQAETWRGQLTTDRPNIGTQPRQPLELNLFLSLIARPLMQVHAHTSTSHFLSAKRTGASGEQNIPIHFPKPIQSNPSKPTFPSRPDKQTDRNT